MTGKIRWWMAVPLAVMLLGDASGSRFDRVVAALKAGETAEALGGRQQAATLRVAADTLVASGARPVEGSENLADRWQSAAAGIDHGHNGPAASYRDRALGPAYRIVNLPGGGKAAFEQVFLAGQRARVSVVAVHNSAFQLSVDDDDHRRVCSNVTSGNPCEWVPSWTTRFSVSLANPRPTAGVYYLVLQ
jgi:hypothetical protein